MFAPLVFCSIVFFQSVHYIQASKEIDFLADNALHQVCYDLEDEKIRNECFQKFYQS